jgi:hypothetical protein
MDYILTDFNWLNCLLHIHANALNFVLPFCFVMYSCLHPCCHCLAALVVGCQILIVCSCLRPHVGHQFALPVHPLIASPTLHLSTASNSGLLWLS